MDEFIRSGRAVDWILVLIALEALAVLGYRALTGRGPAPSSFIGNILAGSSLLVALRIALSGASWVWIGVSLMAAFAAHLADLAMRWEVPAGGFLAHNSRALLVVPRFCAERQMRGKRRVVRSQKATRVA
jgi:membrane protein implicated in regulation of membrane protease activity